MKGIFNSMKNVQPSRPNLLDDEFYEVLGAGDCAGSCDYTCSETCSSTCLHTEFTITIKQR